MRSPSSTCAGSPDPRRPATYLTSGAYVRISRSRAPLFLVCANSCQSCVSVTAATTPPEYELPAPFPHRPTNERPHPDRRALPPAPRKGRPHPAAAAPRRDRNRPLPRERARDGDTAEGERDGGEQHRERH